MDITAYDRAGFHETPDGGEFWVAWLNNERPGWYWTAPHWPTWFGPFTTSAEAYADALYDATHP